MGTEKSKSMLSGGEASVNFLKIMFLFGHLDLDETKHWSTGMYEFLLSSRYECQP